MLRPLRSLAALAALLTAAGCDSPVEPGDLAGTYVVESFGGVALPVEVTNNQFGRTVLLADTLRLLADGTGSRTSVTRTQPAGSAGPGPAERSVTPLGYRMRGSRIEITYVCPLTALCVDGPHASGPASRTVIRLEGDPAPFVFRRVDD